MISFLGGVNSLGYRLDVFEASGIFLIVGVMSVMILFSSYSLKDKFNLIATPLSILFIGLIIGLLVRTKQSEPYNYS